MLIKIVSYNFYWIIILIILTIGITMFTPNGNITNYVLMQRTRLKDYTKEFLEMFENIQNHPSIVIMNLGGKGSGKTAQMFKYIHLFWENLPYGKVAIIFYNAPKSFLEKLEYYMPPEMFEHVYAIYKRRKLTEIKDKYEYMVLCYDEAQRDINAKEALTKDSRGLEKLLSIVRHLNTHLIYNTQNLNVTKNIRSATEFKCYKGNTESVINESDNKFLKRHIKFITNLYAESKISRCAFQASYKKFMNPTKTRLLTQGYLDLDLYEFVPYWNEEISKAYEDVNFDSDFDEYLKVQPDIRKASKLFLEKYPHLQKGDISISEIRGILKRLDPQLFYDVQKYLRDVLDEIKSELFERKQRDLEKSKDFEEAIQEDNIDITIDQLYKYGQKPAEFIQKFYEEQERKFEADIIKNIFVHRNDQDKTARKIGKGAGTINEKLKQMRNNELGYIFEYYCKYNWDLVLLGGNEHVLDAFDKEGRLISIKMRYGRDVKSFDFSKTGNTKNDKDFHPANELANYFDVPFGIIFYYPPWGEKNELKIIKAEPYPKRGNKNINISKTDPCKRITDIEPVKELAQIIENKGIEEAKKFIQKLQKKISKMKKTK